ALRGGCMGTMILPDEVTRSLFFDSRIAQPARQGLLFILSFWNGVNMPLLNHLNFMLYLAQKAIRVAQLVFVLSGNELGPRKLCQCAQGARLADAGFIAAVGLLQRLRK